MDLRSNQTFPFSVDSLLWQKCFVDIYLKPYINIKSQMHFLNIEYTFLSGRVAMSRKLDVKCGFNWPFGLPLYTQIQDSSPLVFVSVTFFLDYSSFYWFHCKENNTLIKLEVFYMTDWRWQTDFVRWPTSLRHLTYHVVFNYTSRAGEQGLGD